MLSRAELHFLIVIFHTHIHVLQLFPHIILPQCHEYAVLIWIKEKHSAQHCKEQSPAEHEPNVIWIMFRFDSDTQCSARWDLQLTNISLFRYGIININWITIQARAAVPSTRHTRSTQWTDQISVTDPTMWMENSVKWASTDWEKYGNWIHWPQKYSLTNKVSQLHTKQPRHRRHRWQNHRNYHHHHHIDINSVSRAYALR